MLDKEMLRQTLGFLQHYELLKKEQKTFDKAIGPENDGGESAWRIANLIAERMGRKDLAIYPFWLDLAARGGKAEAQYQAVCLYYFRGDLDKAYPYALLGKENTAIKPAFRLFFSEVEGEYYLAHRKEDGKAKKAKECFEEILRANKDDTSALYGLALLHHEAGEDDRARTYFALYKKSVAPRDVLTAKKDPEGLDGIL